MSITALPPPPSRTQSAQDFSDNADAFMNALPTFATEANTLQVDVNAKQVATAQSATDAAEQADIATVQATNAAASAAAAVATANAAAWVNGGTYALNANAISQIDFLTYRKQTASSVTTIDPKNDAVNWVCQVGSGKVSRSSRTSNTALSLADKGNLIEITSGTFTQTFAAVASLGDGWFCYLKNSGGGDITLDPNASELIDGLTSFVMYDGETRLIQCTGTALTSTVLSPFTKTFTASGNFTKPPGYRLFGVHALGAGGGGGGSTASGSMRGGAGGAGGMGFAGQFAASMFAATEVVTIGAGGTAGAVGSGSGGAGGNTTIGSFVIAYGGNGGAGAVAFGSSTIASIGGGYGATTGVPSGYIPSTNSNEYPEYAGGTLSSLSSGNYDPPVAGTGSFWGGSTGGHGTINSYKGSAGGVSRNPSIRLGGGGAGALAGAGAGGSAVGTFGGGGGGSGGAGGAGGWGSGGGGAGNTASVGYAGGVGGSGWAQIWGVV